MSTTIILVKHGKPEQVPGRPSHEWPLSTAGREKAPALARRIAAHRPAAIVSSDEPKASETAELIGKELGLAVDVLDDLYEHDRSNVELMRTADFISTMALFFKQPGKLVLGKETAAEALARFEGAIAGARQKYEGKVIAAVTHGTVIALYLEKQAGMKSFDVWRRMGLPSFVALDDAGQIVEEVDAV